jgi:hypothetical protein
MLPNHRSASARRMARVKLAGSLLILLLVVVAALIQWL